MQNKMDFTLSAYKQLISTLRSQGYFFQTFEEYIQNSRKKVVILRHDVDRKPGNALVIAKIEKEVGIRASYYFRIVKESYDEDVIRQIAEMGHEIGYHYENLSEISRKNPQISQINAERKRRISHRPTPVPSSGATGQARTHTDIYPADLAGQKESSLREKKEFRDKLFELAIDDFERNLEKFRELYPVKTICMHGSPLSKWDNRDLWKKYDYRDFGIIAEPYFDIDFSDVFYLTDTGRRWDGDSVSVRDKVLKKEDEKVRRLEGEKNAGMLECWHTGIEEKHAPKQKQWRHSGLRFRKTWDIIEAVENGLLPDKIMLNTHPQRWTDNPLAWTKELVWQNVKNVVKRIIIRRPACRCKARAGRLR